MKKTTHKWKAKAKCASCGRPYGDENGFPDLIIENWAWKKISPTNDKNGLLCPCCIIENLCDLNITCNAYFASGPIFLVKEKKLNNKKHKTHLKKSGVK